MGNRKIVLDGRGPITISDNDHVATGGEGSVYKKAGTIVKIYTDEQKMLRDGMVDKIKLLSGLGHEFVIAPQGLVLDAQSGNPIGYYMPFATGEPLSRAFTNDFRTREKVTDKHAMTLVDRMKQVVSFAHDHDAIMVDANELNWLVEAYGGTGDPKPKAMDVDSWAVGKWPAKVIMPSIRDWHSRVFDKKTDWFSWGIVTFQVFTGIHPYKGMIDGYKPADLEQRMKDNVSVFSPGVRLNRAVRDFSCVPAKLLAWYEGTFQRKERSIPPSPFDIGVAAKAATITRVVVTATGNLKYEKLYGKTNDPIVRVFPSGVVILDSGLLVDSKTARILGKAKTSDCEVVRVSDGWIKAEKVGNNFEYSYIDGTNFVEESVTLNLSGHRLVRYENRLFLVTDQGLIEIKYHNFGKPLLSAGSMWGALVNSTRWYEGVGIMDAMGAMFLVAPFGENACAQVRIPELDGLKPVAAKAGNRFIAIVAVDRNGNYQKVELSFDADYKTYKVWQGGTPSPELNIAILPKLVCATIVEDGKLVIFVPGNGNVTKVEDKAITTEMVLGNLDNNVVYVLDGNLWKLSMNK